MFTKLKESIAIEVKKGIMTKWYQIENINKMTEITKQKKSKQTKKNTCR